MAAIKKFIGYLLLLLAITYLLLLLPDDSSRPPVEQPGAPFVWNRDTSWLQLEAKLTEAQTLPAAVLDSSIAAHQEVAEQVLLGLQESPSSPNSLGWPALEANFFSIAPLIATRKEHLPWLVDYYNRSRTTLKIHSQEWDIQQQASRHRLYKGLYGMRAAVEEVLLVSQAANFPEVLLVHDEASATPSANILGIDVHSGDLLVSRGGAEVSALISRGNDYPGNFSHIALVYVDATTQVPYLIEAHIEKGVAIASVDQYLADKKLRFMVVRPRADLPQLQEDPLLPHTAAEYAYQAALARHIPYDFKMNYKDSTAMFCSEVGSFAYGKMGLQLWQAVSTISSPGIRNWLHTFGVENFVTQMPSDLEYDPQLSVVAEWRNKETLLKDHIDNAVIDALLVRADAGEQITYNTFMLPVARVLKAYCLVLNAFGKEGLIPEGMNATQALKNNTFTAMHQALKQKTVAAVEQFIQQKGYTPPYWQLVKIAEYEQAKTL